MGCMNYKNQEAIDRVIRAANERMKRIDEASGIHNPEPMYEEGVCPCNECADANNPDWLKDMFDEIKKGDSNFHRLCYTPLTLQKVGK